MPDGYTVVDRRGSHRAATSPSGLVTRDLNGEMARLRRQGVTLSNSPVQARVQAKQISEQANSLAQRSNRTATAAMNRSRVANSSRRTGSNLQMAMPKIRQPLGHLADLGIPTDIADPQQHKDLIQLCRMYYACHPLIPLLVDIYSKFPVVGMEFASHDPEIRETYEDMFLDKLNYEEFLPDSLGREYFISGEVTSLGHFDESLAVWSSEEILNPDMVRVTGSHFVEEERVQILFKDMVENLRQGPGSMSEGQESQSERLERNWEYQQLVKYHPEIITAAALDDGLDVSPALWSRLVNKVSDWDHRGTPILLRAMSTLMMEETLFAAQHAVAERMYAPMVIATLGIEDMGDGQPWIPEPQDLDDLRDDFQTAFAADFKFIAHNMGLKVESVFGRESAPNFDSDFERINASLLQVFGIGQDLIMGGSSGTYASGALNREVCEQLMFTFQRKVRRHMRKRMEVIAEAQEHYDYEIEGFVKGMKREPIYRSIKQEDPETGEERIIQVPKLLVPDIKFATLNLRDEQTERAFISQLKQMGVPVSDGTLSVNIPFEFKEELEKQADETVQKMVADSQAIKKAQELADAQKLPYSDDLAMKLQATLQLRQALAATEMAEDQAKQASVQTTQMIAPAATGMGLMPGPDGAPPANDGSQLPPPPPPQDPAEADQDGAQGALPGGPPPAMGAPAQVAARRLHAVNPPTQDSSGVGNPLGITPPKPNKMTGPLHAMGPSSVGPSSSGPTAMELRKKPESMTPAFKPIGPGGKPESQAAEKAHPAIKPPAQQSMTRPAESDSMRGNMPRAGGWVPEPLRNRVTDNPGRSRAHLSDGPSTYGNRSKANPDQVDNALRRRERFAAATDKQPRVGDLVHDRDFYAMTNMGSYEGQIQADWDAIQAGDTDTRTLESAKILKEIVEQYEHATGVRARW